MQVDAAACEPDGILTLIEEIADATVDGTREALLADLATVPLSPPAA